MKVLIKSFVLSLLSLVAINLKASEINELMGFGRESLLEDTHPLSATPIELLLVRYGAAVRGQEEAQDRVRPEDQVLYSLERDLHVHTAIQNIRSNTASSTCNFCDFAQDTTRDAVHLIVASFASESNHAVKVILNLYSYTVANLVILTDFHETSLEALDCATRNKFMEVLALCVRVLRNLNIFDAVDSGFNINLENGIAGGSIGNHVHAHAIGHTRGEHTERAGVLTAELNTRRKNPDIYNLLRDKFKGISTLEQIPAHVQTSSLDNLQVRLCKRCKESILRELLRGKYWSIIVSNHPRKTGTLDIIPLDDCCIWIDDLPTAAQHELGAFIILCMKVIREKIKAQGFNMCLSSGTTSFPECTPAHVPIRMCVVPRKIADSQYLTECLGQRVITQSTLRLLELRELFEKYKQE